MSRRSCLVASFLAPILLANRVSAEVDFAKDIKPILESSCLKCHGSETAKADLRLDSKKALQKGSKKSDNVVVAGKPDDSILYTLVIAPKSAKDRMPPEGDPLPKDKTELIKKWISEGAKWPDDLVLKTPESKGSPEEVGVAITDAEKAAFEKLQKQGVQISRIAQNSNWISANFFHHKDAVKEENLALLKDMPNLYDLGLDDCGITDKEMVHLKSLTNLTKLHLHSNKVTDAGLENLRGLSKLSYLNLYENPGVTDKGLQQFKDLNSLRKLYLWQTKVTNDAAKAFVETMPGLVINLGTDADFYKGKADPPKTEGSGSASPSSSGSGSAPGSGSARPPARSK